VDTNTTERPYEKRQKRRGKTLTGMRHARRLSPRGPDAYNPFVLARAATWLDRAATSGFPCYPWYVSDPLLEPFRRDSSGRAFLERLRAQWEAAKTRYD